MTGSAPPPLLGLLASVKVPVRYQYQQITNNRYKPNNIVSIMASLLYQAFSIFYPHFVCGKLGGWDNISSSSSSWLMSLHCIDNSCTLWRAIMGDTVSLGVWYHTQSTIMIGAKANENRKEKYPSHYYYSAGEIFCNPCPPKSQSSIKNNPR